MTAVLEQQRLGCSDEAADDVITMRWERRALYDFVNLLNANRIVNDVIPGTFLGPWELEEFGDSALLRCALTTGGN